MVARDRETAYADGDGGGRNGLRLAHHLLLSDSSI